MKQQSFSILLILLMSIVSTRAMAYDIEVANADGVTIYYNYINDEEELEVTYERIYGHSYTGNVVIPEEVTYIDKILKVTSIGEKAFLNCLDLTSITIPNSVTSIGKFAFENCSSLTSITIPNSVTSIGNYAFYNCTGLTSVSIGNSVTSIGDYAFWDCSGLTSVTIPNSVTSIGYGAFDGCSGLTSVTIGNSVTSIGGGAFRNCSGLTSVDIPNSVTSIGDGAFGGCSGLTSVDIPNSVTSIGDGAFGGCSGLTSVDIPNSVTSIGKYVFSGCSGLTSVNISDVVAWCNIEFENSTANPLCNAHHLYLNGEEIKDLVIPNSVTNIRDYAFFGCSGLTSVTIPNSVTSIGNESFYWCSGLTSVTIPNSVTTIGDQAFRLCSGLTSVNISDVAGWCNIIFGDAESNPLSCAHHLYLNGEEIKDMVVPNSVTTIGNYAFDGCSGLTSVTIPNSVTNIGISSFYGCSGLTSITIPNSVTSIGNSAFRNCSGLTSVTIPNSVTSIGSSAFYGCSGLTSVTIPNSVTTIEGHTFSGCSGLTSVTIPNSVTSIGSSAFNGCSGLTSVTIPNSVTSISGAFSYCSGLTSITIPNSMTIIGDGAFYGCSGLTSVTIPNSVTTIEGQAFYGCSGLTSVTIPNSVTSIGRSAFRNCSGLTFVTIGSGIESIGDYAFGNCPELTDVYCHAINVPNTKTNAFKDSSIEGAKLYVPAESVEAYKAAEVWSSFGTIQEMVESKVKLSKTKAVIEKGKTLTLKAKVYPTEEDQTVTWKSSDKKVATVTSAGKVKGVGAGTATITCTSKATGAKATCKVTVGYVKLNYTELTVEKGKIVTLKSKVYPSTVKDQSVTWESSDPTIVKVASTGKIKGMKAGKATITCISNATGLKATCEVTVGYVKLNYTALTVEKGKIVTLKSKVYPTTEDQSVTWESSDPTIVKVASTGKIKGVKAGTAIITCTSNATGLSATCKVTVVKASAAPSLDGTDDEVTSIEEKAALVEEFDVYDLNGRKVLNKVTSLEGLSDGVYIVNGKKIVVKK